MSDLISRQDALNSDYRMYDAKSGIEWIPVFYIEDLPSAEPERIIKIGQRSGQTLESAIDYLHSVGWLQEHDRILTESAETEPKWIPVTERLPEKHQRVLVTIKRSDGEMRVRSGNYSDDYFWIDNGDYWKCNEVLAWMPLPEPMRGE